MARPPWCTDLYQQETQTFSKRLKIGQNEIKKMGQK